MAIMSVKQEESYILNKDLLQSVWMGACDWLNLAYIYIHRRSFLNIPSCTWQNYLSNNYVMKQIIYGQRNSGRDNLLALTTVCVCVYIYKPINK